MAATKIWAIRQGSNIQIVLDYVENKEKTVEKYRLVVEQKRSYDKAELQDMTDVMEYAMNEKKTAEKKYVSGINVSVEHARDEMLLTKKQYRKEDGILLWHAYQSFAPDEVTPEEAHAIGRELAKNIWGDYEVIIATHLDREHIHNHFVINSVSFRTGKKLDGKWGELARESDRLCAKYQKTVIENPKFKSVHYAQWEAEKKGKPTWKSILMRDLDDIITRSRSLSDFFEKLKKEGYAYRTEGKYFTVRPPGKERWMRADRQLGEGYSLTGIESRIAENVKSGTVRAISQPKTFKARGKVALPKHRVKGYQALYYYYCYKLGALPKKNRPGMNYMVREELRSMNRIAKETRLLSANKIETEADLECFKREMKVRLDSLKNERKSLYGLLRHADEAEADAVKVQVAAMTKKIRETADTVAMCDHISERSKNLQKKKEQMQNINMEQARREMVTWKEQEKQK